MPRKDNRKNEKSKNFGRSLKKVIKSLKKWHASMILAIVLALIAAIISLIAPNKLSTLTNYITEGITPQVSEETIQSIFNDDNISVEDKMYAKEVFSSFDGNEGNTKDLLAKMDSLPPSVYEKIAPKMDTDAIRNITILLAVLYIISAIFSYTQQYIMAKVTNSYSKMLRQNIIKKVKKLPLKYFDSHETGDVLSRVTNDVDSIGQNMNQSLSQLITSVALFVGSIIMMFITNVVMAISGIVASLLGFLFMSLILSKSQKYFRTRQKYLGDLNGYIEEIYSGHNIVTTYNAVDKTNIEFDKYNKKLFKSSLMSQFLSGIMQPMMVFVGNLGYVAVCVVGAVLVMNNSISFGIIVAFMIYVRLFTTPLSQIAQSITSLQSTVAASERVFEFLEENEMEDESNFKTALKPSQALGNIKFDHVKFGYNKDLVIKDFSIDVLPGKKIAIVGPTGAGKTTLVNLLMKFYSINDGDIVIDGHSIKDLTRENIHDLFVMVLQDTWLFDGTIRENIVFNRKGISDDEVWKVCKTVGIDHFIKTLPNGLDTNVNDNDSISQGQKQLLTIARGMLKDAPFLILDEATSNVDTRTEELVQKAMDKLTEGKTSFIIAHRLSTIKNADLILVVNDGDIVERGTHEELLDKNGFYANLYNSQFEQLS